ncbi:MAG: molecular chaperone DnaK [Deltaproteobacteria bacterium]|nr:molecular chaperone DnaK [Deltaproteobacteria bacterium]
MQIQLKVKGQSEDVVVGIDLGTTNSLVARVVDGEPKVVADRHGRAITPSVISIDEEGHAVVGDEAKTRALLNPAGTLTSIKRFMGRGVDDVTDVAHLPYKIVRADLGEQAAILVHGKKYLPQELSAMVLTEAKKRAERAQNLRIRRAVITVPAYFDDAQRQATRDAGRIAGIDVLRIINEPTAAALAYGLDKGKRGTVLVYDLGGGTFDVSLLKLTDGVFKVIATTGNTRLGGDDFDNAVTDVLVSNLSEEQLDAVRGNPRALSALKTASEQAKIALSSEDETTVAIDFADLGVAIERTVTRADYEVAIAPLLDKTMAAVDFVLEEADLDPEDVDEVVCVGGSTRTPAVRARLEKEFEKPPHTELDPDQVVALGAALQAEMLSGDGDNDQVLLDVTPLSLGIETYGGGVTKLIWRNSPVPIRATEGFTTQVDDQTAVMIHVLQGEREMAKDLRSLGRFTLRGIPAMSAGMPRVLVEYFIDANGILKVTAKEMTSGTKASIEVKPTYGLTDEQVEDMILDSIEHAEEDIEAHILADKKAEAESMLRYSRKALGDHGELVPDAIRTGVEIAIAALEEVLQGDDKEAIEAASDVLNENTAPIASAMMDEVLRVTVHGRTIGDVLGSQGARRKASDIDLSKE